MEQLCFNVSIDGLKLKTDQGLDDNLLSIEVSRIVKFPGYISKVLFQRDDTEKKKKK